MSSSIKNARRKPKKRNNFKQAKKKQNKNFKSKPIQNTFKTIEQKCIKLFGSKKKANKFIKQALLKGNKIRTKTKHLRYDYQGYQILIKNNDIKTNKKLGIKALINIEFDGGKTVERIKQNINNNNNKNINFNSNDKSSKYPSLYPKEFQYKSKDKILILGEMDFSYALDIAYNIGGRNIVATAYYQKGETKDKTKKNIQMLNKLEGKRVVFDVDATALTLDSTHKFNKILFGFPRDSRAPNSQKHNIIFMKEVFEQVGKYLKKEGQFQLLLHINKSGHSPLEQWKLDYVNWRCVHEQIFEQKDMKKMFGMYQSHDGQNNEWVPYKTGLYVFKMTQVSVIPKNVQ